MFRLEIWLVVFEFPFAETTKPLCYFLPCFAGTLRTVSIYETAEAFVIVFSLRRENEKSRKGPEKSALPSAAALAQQRRSVYDPAICVLVVDLSRQQQTVRAFMG